MTRFHDIGEANERLREVRPILERLRGERAELIRLRDEVLARTAAGGEPDGQRDPDLKRIHLRIQGLVDQMQAGVTRLVEWDVTLRDIETGLIDFPALASGRQIWLCWRLGEGDIAWWHELDAGFSGRVPLAELA